MIGVISCRTEGPEAEVSDWLMSCRVLKRGIEHCLLNHLCDIAIARGLERMRGVYIPTPKNALVREHYASLGFTQVAADAAGRNTWELELKDWQPRRHFIDVTTEAVV